VAREREVRAHRAHGHACDLFAQQEAALLTTFGRLGLRDVERGRHPYLTQSVFAASAATASAPRRVSARRTPCSTSAAGALITRRSVSVGTVLPSVASIWTAFWRNSASLAARFAPIRSPRSRRSSHVFATKTSDNTVASGSTSADSRSAFAP